MKTATQHILGAEPVMSKPGQPLRIAEYGRVAEAIVSGRALPGSMLPTEAEVGETLGVSRTVVREALMLLEEDQLITTRRGIGRFVALEPAKFGLERIAPFDELLRSAEPNRTFALSNLEAAVQDGTEFTARGLDVEDSTPTWFWEHIVTRDGRPVAILQEHVVATDEASDGFSEQRRRASAVATEMAGRASTLLSLIRKDLGPELGPGEVEISTSVLGSTRARQLGATASQPILVLTQKISRQGEAFYLAKCLIVPDFVRLVVHQASVG